MAETQNAEKSINAGNNVEPQQELSLITGVTMKRQPLWTTLEQVLTKLNVVLPNDLATVLLNIYPKAWKTYVYTKTCAHVYK